MLKNRHAIKKRDARRVAGKIQSLYSCSLPKNSIIEKANLFNFDVIIVDGSLDFIDIDGNLLFTLLSIDKYKPKKRYVTVDKGAVRFVANGADIMLPGIIDADKDIMKGDPVWIKEETYGKTLSVGISLYNGESLVEMNRGKGIRNIHWVGDRIWNFISKSL